MTNLNQSKRLALFKKAFEVSSAEKTILIASTFRSGSTFVASLLNNNGLHGLDREKYNEIWKYVNASDEQFYNACLDIAKSTKDGLFTTKLMWPHRNMLANCLHIGRTQSDDFASAFPEAKWLLVCREDKVKQSISFWRAKQSGRWHIHKVEKEPEIQYDYRQIRACYNEIVAYDGLWEDFFKQASVIPFRINYEDFQSDLDTKLSEALEFIGDYRDISHPFSLISPLKKQSDEMSKEYYERFMEDSYKNS